MDHSKFLGRMAEAMRQAIAEGLSQEDVVAAFEDAAQQPAEGTIAKEVLEVVPPAPRTVFIGETTEYKGCTFQVRYVEDGARARAGFRYLLELMERQTRREIETALS